MSAGPPERGRPWTIVVAAIAFSLSSPLARLARPAHPFVIACGRVALAAVILCAVDPRGLARSASALGPSQRARVALAGLLLAAHFALFQWGLDETSLPAAVSLVSLEPLSVVLVAWFFFGIEPKRLEKLGVAIATVGAVVVGQGAGEGEHHLFGDLLVLGAVALFGLYVASARALKDALPARHYAPLVYAAAGLALAVTIPFAPQSSGQTWPLELHSIAAIAAIAVVPTVIGHTLVQAAARTLSPSLVALVSPGETLGSIAIAMVLWQKPPRLLEAVGGAIILGGSLVAIRGARAGQRDG